MRTTVIKTLSFNIHKGFDFWKSRFVIEDLRMMIRELGADLVFLQEVQELHGRTHKLDSGEICTKLEFLADSIWPHFAYGKNAVYSEGHHGNAILSRFPFRGFENIDISTNQYEKRGLLHGEVELEGDRGLHVLCTHLNLFEASRTKQVEALSKRISSHVTENDPILLVGDFNDWRGIVTPILKSGLKLDEAFLALQGSHIKSFPNFLPLVPLDRVYFRGLEALEAKVLDKGIWRNLSDHLPIYCEFALGE